MVMEYLDGDDLAAWIKQRGALPIEQAIEFVLQACVAVADAHALGIIHRDLKPANLFCVRRSDGQLSIKVLDFGISKMVDRSESARGSMTRTSALMGSPLYMSPEQMRSSKNVDAKTDIWALGVILFELIAGRPPFEADAMTELAIRINSEPTPAIRSLRREVPVELEAIIFRCLEKDRRKRYPNVAELALALAPFAPQRARASVDRISGILRGMSLSASAPGVSPSPPKTTTLLAPETVAPVERTTGGSKGRKTAIWAGVAGAVALVGGVGSMLSLKRHRDDPRASAVQTAMVADPPRASVGMAPAPASAPAAPMADSPSQVAMLPGAQVAVSALPARPPAEAPAHPIARPVAPSGRPAGSPPRAAQSMAALPASAAATSPPAMASKPSCNPPYVIDAAGDHQYKPEYL
jgi:serine/threonine-protein kinase